MADGKIGTKFEDFTILKVLSRGKYGFVAKVKSKIDNKIYAIKRIDLKLIKNEKVEAYYENTHNWFFWIYWQTFNKLAKKRP